MQTRTPRWAQALLEAALIATALVFALPAAHAAIYVKIPGVTGDVTAAGYDNGDWFEVRSGSYGVDRDLLESGEKGGTADINIGVGELKPIGIVGELSRASAPLFQAGINGNSLGEVEIHLVEFPDGETKPVTFSIIKLTRTFVLSYTTEGGADERPWYHARFVYNAIEVTNFHPKASDPREPVEFTTTWNLVTNTGSYKEGTTNTNQEPTVSTIRSMTVPEDGSLTIPFTVTDPDGPAADLGTTGRSDNQTLLPKSRITTSGTGSSRFLTISPAPNRHGTTTVTVIVSDSSSSVSTSFELTVEARPDAPSIDPIASQLTDADTPLTVAIDPRDPDQANDALSLSADASDPTLLPDGSITFSHDGTGWAMTLSPATGRSGSADVKVNVTDDSGATTSTTFLLTVNSDSNSAPTDILLSPGTIPENSPDGTLVGTLSAIDPDEDPSVTFELIDDAGGRFSLANANQIVATALANLDTETAPSHPILVRATDSQNAVFAKSLTVTVTNVNEPPSVALDLPPSLPASPPAPGPIPIPYPNISLADPDAGAGDVTVTLGVIHGTLRLDDSSTLFGRVIDNNSRAITVSAPIADLHAVLAESGFTYTPDPGYEGADSLSVTINDNGNSGDGDALAASGSEPFLVRPDPLLDWFETNFTPEQRNQPEISDLLQDPEGDGLATLLEYKLARNPLAADADDMVELVKVRIDAQPYLELSIIQRSDESDPNTTLVAEISTNLSGWHSGPGFLNLVSRTPLPDNLERVTLRSAISLTDAPLQFFRLHAAYSGFAEPFQ